jgi:hypothetical protein
MFRFLLRVLAVVVLAAGFASLIVDGTRSIAGAELSVTPMSAVLGSRLQLVEQVVKNIHPLLWDPVVVGLMRVPAWVGFCVAGLLILRLGRRREQFLRLTSQA